MAAFAVIAAACSRRTVDMVSNRKYLARFVRGMASAALAINAAAVAASDTPAGVWGKAASLIENTHLVELQQGSRLSGVADSLQNGGYESANGQWIGFKNWYRSKWTDSRASWMTQLSPNWGVIWGGSTGERAEKYTIAPSLKLGLVFQATLEKNAFVSLKGTSIIGGRLKEKSCIADYGEIGGVQEVNCRLAATPLEPSETLRYNVDMKPLRHAFFIQFTKLF